MKTRTFQEIYDFCRTDDTYRSYFEASDESRITGARARKYYYGDIRRGQCRVGTFIYCQSMRQLERFLEGARQDHYIHVDPPACREVSLKDDMFPGQTAYTWYMSGGRVCRLKSNTRCMVDGCISRHAPTVPSPGRES